MQQRYNNPAFASGLSRLVDNFIGNPQQQAQTELLTSKARLNNDTTSYREAIGEAGRAGNLADMMISALQAGSDFSREAPEISAAIASLPGSGFSRSQQGDIQVGAGVQSARNTFSGLAQVLARAGGGGGGRRRGGSGGSAKVKPLTAGGRSVLMSNLKAQGVTGVDALPVLEWVDNQVSTGTMSENQAIAHAAQNLDRERIVTNEGGTVLSRLMDGFLGNGPREPDEVEFGSVQGVVPVEGVTSEQDVDAIFAEADAAIAAGADPLKVKQRLMELGLDVSGL